MASARIGERGKPPAATPTGRGTTRFGAALASSTSILVIVPGLVVLVGAFLTLAGDRSLRGSNLEMAGDRLAEETRLVASSVGHALEQSSPVLDRLALAARAHGPNQSFDAFAHTLADLMNGRPGIAYVSVSFPDGTFQGAYLDDDGVVRFQDSRVESGGTRVRRYHLDGSRALRLQREERTDYDPRARDFYRLALEHKQRVWTAPYPFFKTHYTGITRAEPLYDGDGALRAVVTVDFDVHRLSQYLRGRQLPGMRALLFADDGTLLADPQGVPGLERQLSLRPDRPLRASDLDDPVLSAFFSRVDGGDRKKLLLRGLESNGERFLTSVVRASSDQNLPWYVAYIVPEAYFLRGLQQYQHSSAAIGAFAVVTAMLIAWLFARHIVRVQREAVEARAQARAAQRAAHELGSYRLVAALGRGGMGEVWKAEHRLLARQAAIKLIKSDASGVTAEELRTRFRREAEALASLRSRNTIELFDYGVAEDGTFYFVMELLDGMDLESLVSAFGPQPAARVISILIQACNSLAEAHDAGLVHRDIKPANLFLCRAADELDIVKVLDFGLVRAAAGSLPSAALEASSDGSPVSVAHPARNSRANGRVSTESDPAKNRATTGVHPELTRPDGLMGTPGYMAPEQALAHPIDHRVDLYALGCVAFTLLTGRTPYEASDALRLMIAHINQPIPDLRAAAHGYLPDDLVSLITACLAKDPAARPASARALGLDLRAISIPPEHAWTNATAAAWWNKNHPRRTSLRGPGDSSRELNVAVDVA